MLVFPSIDAVRVTRPHPPQVIRTPAQTAPGGFDRVLADLPAMDLRSATREDAPEIAALLAALGYPTDHRDVETRLGRLGDSDAVLIADGGLIALHRIPLLAEGGAMMRIAALVVAPDRRSQGVGRALLAAAQAVAEQWGLRSHRGLQRASRGAGRRPRLLSVRGLHGRRTTIRAVLEATRLKPCAQVKRSSTETSIRRPPAVIAGATRGGSSARCTTSQHARAAVLRKREALP